MICTGCKKDFYENEIIKCNSCVRQCCKPCAIKYEFQICKLCPQLKNIWCEECSIDDNRHNCVELEIYTQMINFKNKYLKPF